MYFPSKKDSLAAFIYVFSLLILLGTYIAAPAKEALYIIVPLAVFAGWTWFGTGYTVSDTNLLVKCGPLRWKIPLENIRKVSRTRDYSKSPALSFDKLEIQYSKSKSNFNKSILISPANTDDFLNILKQRCPRADIR